jgi:hypothetical protein
MKKSAQLLCMFSMIFGLFIGLGGTASALPGTTPASAQACTGVWSLRNDPVNYWADGRWAGFIHTQVRECDGESHYRANLVFGNPLPAGQWANAFLDIYIGGSYWHRLTCDDAWGSGHVTPGKLSCYTSWLANDDYEVTFVSAGYIYRASDNVRIGSGATQNCSRWRCIS